MDYNCELFEAIDGYSGKLLYYFTIHRKNSVNVCEMYRLIVIKYGYWYQFRTDHGNEFMLMSYHQHKLKYYLVSKTNYLIHEYNFNG